MFITKKEKNEIKDSLSRIKADFNSLRSTVCALATQNRELRSVMEEKNKAKKKPCHCHTKVELGKQPKIVKKGAVK